MYKTILYKRFRIRTSLLDSAIPPCSVISTLFSLRSRKLSIISPIFPILRSSFHSIE
nr:MAG TPA: hypothetical protein [Caudoviricetes sp.]